MFKLCRCALKICDKTKKAPAKIMQNLAFFAGVFAKNIKGLNHSHTAVDVQSLTGDILRLV